MGVMTGIAARRITRRSPGVPRGRGIANALLNRLKTTPGGVRKIQIGGVRDDNDVAPGMANVRARAF